MEASCRFHPWASSRHCRGICARNMATATTMSVTISRHSEYMRSRFIRRRLCCGVRLAAGRFPRRRFCTAVCRSAFSARPTRQTTTAFSGQWPAVCEPGTRRCALSQNLDSRSNANRQPPVAQPRMPLRRWSIPALVHVPLEILPPIANSAIPAETTTAGLTSPIPRST